MEIRFPWNRRVGHHSIENNDKIVFTMPQTIWLYLISARIGRLPRLVYEKGINTIVKLDYQAKKRRFRQSIHGIMHIFFQ